MREAIGPLIFAFDVVEELVAGVAVVGDGVFGVDFEALVVEGLLDSLVLGFALGVELAHQVSDLDASVVSQKLHIVIASHIALNLVSNIVRLLHISHILLLLRLATRLWPDNIGDHKYRVRLGGFGSG